MPALEREEFFEVLPPARVRGPAVDGRPAVQANPYVAGLVSHWSDEGWDSLPELLSTMPHPRGPDGFPQPRALIVDQLEEVFTDYPDRWRERPDVFRQLAAALDADPLLRVILAIREDYLAQLEPFRSLLPGRLEDRIRLELLDPDAAREAVVGPLRATNRRFAPSVAEQLVSELRETAMTDASGHHRAYEGQYVEPVQLQLVCSALWRDLPPYVTEITDDHVRRFGDVDQVLTEFYEHAVAEAAAAARMSEPALRQSFSDTFITSMHTRGTAYETGRSVGSMPLAAIEVLERRRVIRAEWRANARWYELTHDRLIEPIERSNQSAAIRSATNLATAVRGTVGALAGVLLAAVPATALANDLQTDGFFTPARGAAYRALLSAIVLAAAAVGWALATNRSSWPRRAARAFVVGGVAGGATYLLGRALRDELSLLGPPTRIAQYALLGAVVGAAGLVAPGGLRPAVVATVAGGLAYLLVESLLLITVVATVLIYVPIVAGAWLPELERARRRPLPHLRR